jgi:hypothetical protein
MSRFESNVDPDIALTFQTEAHGFVSRNAGGFISCPPCVIVRCAAHRVPPESLNLPDGYDREMLDRIMGINGFVDRDVHVSDRQAQELAEIGVQLLDLHSEGKVQPPLGYFEEQAVAHLVRVVSRTGR